MAITERGEFGKCGPEGKFYEEETSVLKKMSKVYKKTFGLFVFVFLYVVLLMMIGSILTEIMHFF